MTLLLALACTNPSDDSGATDSAVAVDSGTPGDSDAAIDADGDGYPADQDCDDADPAVNPGAQEVCDELATDEDCDGLADDADDSAVGHRPWYVDVDGDGYGDDDSVILACTPAGAEEGGDCDDGNDAVHPDADEVCGDGLDNDCDGGLEVCRLEGELPETPLFVLTIDDGLNVGTTVDWVDLDGDGELDLVVGDSWGERATVVQGPVQGPRTENASTSAVFTAGLSYDSDVGDLDGDGADDLFLGAYEDEQVHALFGGGVTLVAGEQGLGDVADVTWSGSGDFGSAVALLGDTDGDGTLEMGFGAQSMSSGSGGLAVVSGTDGGALSTSDFWIGGGNYQRLGSSGSIAGADLDGDGLADVVAGEMYAEDYQGAAHVLYGGWSAVPGGGIEDARDAAVLGGEDWRMGHEALAAGDVDGDGLDDVWVAGLGLASTGYGRVALLSGSTTRVTGTSSFEDAAVLLVGDRSGELLGSDLGVGDLDGDGQSDLIAGSEGYSTWAAPPFEEEVHTGSVRVFYGPFSGTLNSSEADAWMESETDIGLGAVGTGPADGLDRLALSQTSNGRVLGFEAAR